MTRRGLGRGLDALISSTEPSAGDAPGGAVLDVAIDAIEPNPYQPRRTLNAAELEELAASIRVHGLIQPLVVAGAEDGLRYTIIAGERRWRAASMAGLDRVPVVVREATDQQMLALAIIENVQRSDLNPIEAAEGYRQLIDGFGMTQAEVADLIGKSRAAVANTLRLLGLPDDIRDWVASGALSEGHGRALLAVVDVDVQRDLASDAVREGWSVRRMERETRAAAERSDDGPARRTASRRAGAVQASDPNTEAARRELESALGTRVEIRRHGEGGQVVVHFYSEEELTAIYDRLLGGG